METQPGAQFQSGWWGIDLAPYRPCDSTYRRYPYSSLPPLLQPDESLSWLAQLDAGMAPVTPPRNPDYQRAARDALIAHAHTLGLALPPAFVRLISSPDLQARIPSCTACEFDLASVLLPCPGKENGYIATFLRDQQYTVLWYLYLEPGGDQRILAFPGDMEEDLDEAEEEGEEITVEEVAAQLRECAPSFTSFIYRFWLENTIWFKLHSRASQPLTDAEQAYLDWYSQQRSS